MEALTDSYDVDPVGSLTLALSALVGREFSSWDTLVEALPLPGDQRRLLLHRDTAAMDALVKRLVEFRSLEE